MTVSSATSVSQYTASGGTTFTGAFKILDEDDVEVYVDDTLKTITTDYTISGVGSASFSVVFLSSPASGSIITIRRVVAITQEVDYLANDSFPAETHEEALDRLTMVCQQLQAQIDRVLQAPISDDTSIDLTLPSAADRANALFGFDANGEPTVVEDLTAADLVLSGLAAVSTPLDIGDLVLVSQGGTHKKATLQELRGLKTQQTSAVDFTYTRALYGDLAQFFFNAGDLSSDITVTFPAAEGVVGALAIFRNKEDSGHNINILLEDPDNPGTYSTVDCPANSSRLLIKATTGGWWSDFGEWINGPNAIAVKGESIFTIITHEDDEPRLIMIRNDGGGNEQNWHAFRIDPNGSLVIKDNTANVDRIAFQTDGRVNFLGSTITGSYRVTETRSGAQTSNDANKWITTSGALTVPAEDGWWAYIVLGGDHDITVGALGTLDVSVLGLGTGDVLFFQMTSTTTFKVVKIADALDVIDQGDLT